MVSKAEKRAARVAAAKASAKPTMVKDGQLDPAMTPPEAPKAPAVKRVGVVKVLKTDAKFRGAREAWYNVLKEFEGKPIADYEAACVAKPPSLPKSGKAEKPSGWIGYFQRTGILSVVQEPK